MPRACRCHVEDWRALRVALGWSQADLADRIGIHKRTLQRFEVVGAPHACPGNAAILLLRLWLREPVSIAALAAAGIAHPWPSDLGDVG